MDKLVAGEFETVVDRTTGALSEEFETAAVRDERDRIEVDRPVVEESSTLSTTRSWSSGSSFEWWNTALTRVRDAAAGER